MISEKLCERIRREGLKNDYKFGKSGGEYDDNGNFIFVIRLLPTGNRLAKIKEQKVEKELGDEMGAGAIYQTITCKYCGRKHNKAYYPPFCDACGASLELGNAI